MPRGAGSSKGASQAAESQAAIRRKLREAPREQGFSPAALLGDGSALLEKANRIQGFLKGQKHRTGAGNVKTEWLLTTQQLQDEAEALEKELSNSLRPLLAASHDADMTAFAADALAQWQAQVDSARAEEVAQRQQLQAVARMVRTVRREGAGAVAEEVEQIREVLQTMQQDSRQECETLAMQAERLSEEMQHCWPSAVPNAASALASAALTSVAATTPAAGVFRSALSLPTTLDRGGSGAGASSSGNGGGGGSAGGLKKAVSLAGPAQGLTPIAEEQAEAFEDLITGGDNWDPALDAWAAPSAASGGTGPNWTSNPHALAWERDMHQLDRLVACFPLADDTSKARVRVVFAALRQRHQQKVDAWQEEAVAAARAAGGDERGSLTLSHTGGWPEAEHSLFVSLRMRCWREHIVGGSGGGGGGAAGKGGAGKGASREALMRQLAVLMPTRSLAELVAHDDWLTQHKLLLRKRRALLDAWAHEKAQFLEDSAALLDESHQMAAARAEVAANRLAHELTREAVRSNLEDLRAITEREAAAQAVAQAAAQAEAAQRQAELEAAAREEHARNKQLIAAYRAEVQRQLEQEARARAEAQAEEEAARQARQVVNKERVEWRHAEYLWKLDKAKEAKEAAESEARARAERLDRLRALVAPDVQADPMRVLLPTEASSAVDDKVPGAFKDVHGYSSEQVFRDHRMRVMEALQAAGLHTTAYGRQAITAAPAATRTRVDNLTFDQRAPGPA